MPPLVKWGLKIYPATSSYHTRSHEIRWQEVIGMNKFAKEAGINNPKIVH